MTAFDCTSPWEICAGSGTICAQKHVTFAYYVSAKTDVVFEHVRQADLCLIFMSAVRLCFKASGECDYYDEYPVLRTRRVDTLYSIVLLGLSSADLAVTVPRASY